MSSSTDDDAGGADDEPLFDERITGYHWPMAILVGFWTFLTGYAVMTVVVFANTGDLDQLLNNPGLALTEVGITFYNAHTVVANVVIVEQIANPDQLPAGIDRLSGPTDLPKFVYYGIPVVTLVLIGGLLARSSLDSDAHTGEAALPAAGIAFGYTVAAALGTFVVRQEQAQGVILLVPDLTESVVFGLAYGLGFSLLGALAVLSWRNRERLREQLREQAESLR